MSTLNADQLKHAYRRMKTIREFEERLHVEIATGKIAGFTHLYSGQEAIAVGVCEHLSDADAIVSTHRGHGHCIAKGADVPMMMKEIWGSTEGTCNGKGGSMHIAEIDRGILGANGIVGGGPPIAVGAALASKLKNNNTVAVSFGGDGSSNQGTTFEAMNMAVCLKVPKVFVMENNGYSENTGASYSSGGIDIAARAASFGMPVFKADGADFFSVYEASEKAIAHSRSGNGPSIIYATMMRYFGHFEGDPQLYRAKGEVEELRKTSDCLQIFRKTITDQGLFESTELDSIDDQVMTLIEESVEAAMVAPRGTPDDVLTDVYINY
ncbi:MAG: pyruvate dehydrogenase E1 component alpha subunit [Oceanicoccus sp.]|jgi:pyruvate dehydrogenase E1 component alpha subunit